MSESLARACGEFTVSRRIPWEHDEGLRPHIDGVVDLLRDHDASAEIDVDADLEEAHVRLSLVVVVTEDEVGEDIARRVIGQAIRSSGGRHDGLFAPAEEARLEVQTGMKTGLWTAKWSLHNPTCEDLGED